jgi:hypothetical protein
LPVVRTGHPLTDPLALIVSFYAMIEAVAVVRGLDPDMPRHLKKVTDDLKGGVLQFFLWEICRFPETQNLVFRPLSFPAVGPRPPLPPAR